MNKNIKLSSLIGGVRRNFSRGGGKVFGKILKVLSILVLFFRWTNFVSQRFFDLKNTKNDVLSTIVDTVYNIKLISLILLEIPVTNLKIEI